MKFTTQILQSLLYQSVCSYVHYVGAAVCALRCHQHAHVSIHEPFMNSFLKAVISTACISTEGKWLRLLLILYAYVVDVARPQIRKRYPRSSRECSNYNGLDSCRSHCL
jgi:hypothetical protein